MHMVAEQLETLFSSLARSTSLFDRRSASFPPFYTRMFIHATIFCTVKKQPTARSNARGFPGKAFFAVLHSKQLPVAFLLLQSESQTVKGQHQFSTLQIRVE